MWHATPFAGTLFNIIAFISLRLFIPMEPIMEELSTCRESIHVYHEGCVAAAAYHGGCVEDTVDANVALPSAVLLLRLRDRADLPASRSCWCVALRPLKHGQNRRMQQHLRLPVAAIFEQVRERLLEPLLPSIVVSPWRSMCIQWSA